ncbi:MAG: exodeoxyribonuclease VII small subunit [Kiritimatiellae bacterium]|nr:exodeoxyribonuclease VII small subunit [Kiritimatiellia bacterium]
MARKEQATVRSEELGFEAALERLEALVQRMENGEMGLDEMVAAFEDGQRLIQLCTRKLNEVERRIALLVKGADGQVTTAPFTPEDGSDDKSP